MTETFDTYTTDGDRYEVVITADLGGGKVRVEVLDSDFDGITMTLRRKLLVSRGPRTVAAHV